MAIELLETYGDLYRHCVAALHPSNEVIDHAYTSRLVEHFYASEEIARFREFWSVRDERVRATARLEP